MEVNSCKHGDAKVAAQDRPNFSPRLPRSMILRDFPHSTAANDFLPFFLHWRTALCQNAGVDAAVDAAVDAGVDAAGGEIVRRKKKNKRTMEKQADFVSASTNASNDQECACVGSDRPGMSP